MNPLLHTSGAPNLRLRSGVWVAGSRRTRDQVVLNVDTEREGMTMPELVLVVEPEQPIGGERLDALTQGLGDDLRVVTRLQVTPVAAADPGHGTKSPQAWELGMLAVGGLFSATTMRAIAQIAIAYAERTRARSIRIRRGDTELVITGSTRIDDPALVTGLARLIEASSPSGPALPPSTRESVATPPPAPRPRSGGAGA
ncbi:hypothetical protein [Micromonospora sp. WMMD812]|uniref:hypothetical protein n=1 Tax=Micromonospora sp. WMMD812 TaxID=3015152 RepID=UPI00248CF195|nr:hypothetical protein [Micromonospora sp. WMMD812]WBB68835.1 hypothetical protein O7603_05570 [Micromonospora sp. WMMD812]